MRPGSSQGANCSIAAALEIVGERWSLLVVREAFLGARRFEAFQEHLGIARNILAARLRSLVEHGVLERTPYSERPLRHEYSLTEKGLALFPVIVVLMTWGDRFSPRGNGPPIVLVDRETGAPLVPELVDARTGRAVEPRRTSALPGPGANATTRRRLAARAASSR